MSQSKPAESETEVPFHAIIDADKLAEYIDNTNPVVDEAKLHCNDDGLQITAVGPANVGMTYPSLDAAAFESYEGADTGVLGINVNRLDDILGLADSGDLAELEYDPETRKLHVRIEGLEYTLALIDPDSIRSEPDIPDLELPTVVTLEGQALSRAFTAADMVSDHLEFRADADAQQFVVDAEGDTDDVHLEFDADEDLIDAELPEDTASLFSLDYLKDMGKPIPKDAEVRLRLGDEFPVKIDFEIADGDGEARFMLAPRIQSD